MRIALLPRRSPRQTLRSCLFLSLLVAQSVASVSGCRSPEDAVVAAEDAGAPPDLATRAATDIELTAADFACILKWPKVRQFRITNKLGNLDGSLAVASSPGMSDYPVGTLIQLVPTEAMVKRGAGFSSKTNDWEFFSLQVTRDATTILARGTDQVINQFGGNCLNCHAKAEKKFDFLCEKTHGCDPLPIGDDVIQQIQDADPRCR